MHLHAAFIILIRIIVGTHAMSAGQNDVVLDAHACASALLDNVRNRVEHALLTGAAEASARLLRVAYGRDVQTHGEHPEASTAPW
jgi:hypothetical protein